MAGIQMAEMKCIKMGCSNTKGHTTYLGVRMQWVGDPGCLGCIRTCWQRAQNECYWSDIADER